jgi:integrase
VAKPSFNLAANESTWGNTAAKQAKKSIAASSPSGWNPTTGESRAGTTVARGVVNNRVGRIKRVFKWAVAEELVPPSVHHGLQAVGGLRFGRSEARETEPVKPAAEEHVLALLPFVAPPVAAMIQLQWLTGMRSCELVIMRPCDIDMTGDVWIYEAYDHKNRWRGHRKLVALGPRAQAIIRPFLDRDKEAFLFSPREAEAWRLARRPVHYKPARKTPIYPSELKAREKAKQARRRRKPKRPKRDHYDTASYRRAIVYGLNKARKGGVEISHWHPHQLRHSCGTETRKRYGVEGAQIALGHARADVTQVYAEKNLELAKRIARETG